MEVVYPCCAGLDVHRKVVVACVRAMTGGAITRTVESFPATAAGLRALRDWLAAARCTHVVLEATGVYWKPVWHLLEERFTLVLANPQHVRALPGRKSDVNDAVGLADLLAHDLVRSSFVPPRAIQELRELLRTRRQLVRARTQHVQRIDKILATAAINLRAVVSKALGDAGRAILTALAAGEDDPARLAALGGPRLPADSATRVTHLTGVAALTAHQRFLLRLHLAQIAALETAIADLVARATAQLQPFRAAVGRLNAIPGLAAIGAATVIAEIGTEMRRFPTPGHLRSWVGLVPRLDESAGHRRSTRTRRAGRWLKPVLIPAAWTTVRHRNSYFAAQFHRLKARRGAKKAIVAVAASMLTAIYYILRDDRPFTDLGGHYFDRRDSAQLTRRLLASLAALGVEVEVKTAA